MDDILGTHTTTAPGELLDALVNRVARMRRHRRWRLAAAAAVLVAATAAGWGLQARQAQPPAPVGSRWALSAAGFNPATRAGVTVRYAARAWGTQLEVHVTGIPAGTTCQFWVTSSSGHEIPAGAWAIPGGRQSAWYPASAPVPVSALRGFEVTSAGKTLVTARPPRAAAAPRTRRLTLNLPPARGYRK
jgi:hypothetical protein